MMKNIEKQIELSRSAICIVKGMEAYAATDADNCFLVGNAFMSCLRMVVEQMDYETKVKFDEWLKTKM